ncbi:MAG TPA: hypothetical protein VF862_03695 [Gemmatimonadales bacterium]
MRAFALLFTIAVLACGGKAVPVGMEAGPEGALSAFMQAVADSNLNRMAQLWGTEKGSAAQTGQPQDYQRRVAVMYAYLRGATVRVLGEVERRGSTSVLATEVSRADCVKRVPFTMVQTGRGAWLLTAVDISLIGVPGTPCPSEQRRPPG